MPIQLDPPVAKSDMAKPFIRIPFVRIRILIGLTMLIVAGATIICCQAPLRKKYTNSAGIEFVLIPAGSFTMGSSKGDNNEQPPHEVKIAHAFYLQTTEVTQGQWKKVMGYNLSEFYKCGDDCPEEAVSWEDAQRFIEKLNQLEKTNAYRFPSEAEWEYACRTGTTTDYSFGDDAGKLGEYAWHSNNAKGTTHRVATREPTSWGLYDMHGNVWE
jgi:formylglycine-generating enzyme required for sulfatase activity